MIPLRNPRGLDPTLTDAIWGAFAEDRTVTLESDDHGFAVVVDGEPLAEVASESFDYPLHRLRWTDVELALDALLQAREKDRAEARRERFADRPHTDAEGVDP